MTTRSLLRDDFVGLGVRHRDVIMVHSSVRSVGVIVGGVNVLMQALFDVIGPEGTLTAYVDFEPFYTGNEDPREIPVFDKRIAHAASDHGVLHETLRNWPGAVRSDHPDAGVVAVGARATWITADHPLHYGYGMGSPFEKIVQADGRVLLIGAPLDTITMLHHAEHKANIPGKRVRRYRGLMPTESGPAWTDFEEFETGNPVSKDLPRNCFARIASDYLEAGFGSRGRIGEAASFLFEASSLVSFGTSWLEGFVSSSDG